MEKRTDAVFEILRAAAAEANAKGDKWIVIDCAYEHMDALGDHDFDEVLAQILALVERYPQLDFGGPGPFGDFIEREPVDAYADQLLASLERRPSVQVVGWLDRIMRAKCYRRQKAWAAIPPSRFALAPEAVLRHPLAAEDCRSFSRECLADIDKG
ncbi:hypothetical protein [Tahibacter sp.]|uniref:hypothetical protein n=1 Tax=Tahibacter sp. TaxID=2056211 RepID=UPI0028C44D28|nr:hypothetical protein [Tahibacter sp.]